MKMLESVTKIRIERWKNRVLRVILFRWLISRIVLKKVKKEYWHKLTKKEKTFLETPKYHITWGQIMKKFKQPDWCKYPMALKGEMGCWTLVGVAGWKEMKQTVKRKCNTCDLSKHYQEPANGIK